MIETVESKALLDRASCIELATQNDTQLGVERLTMSDFSAALERVVVSDVLRPSSLEPMVYIPPTYDQKGVLILRTSATESSSVLRTRDALRNVIAREIGLIASHIEPVGLSVVEIPSVANFETAFSTIHSSTPQEMGVPTFTHPTHTSRRSGYITAVANGKYPYNSMEDATYHDLRDHGLSILFFPEIVRLAVNQARFIRDSGRAVTSHDVDYVDVVSNPAIGIKMNGEDDDRINLEQINTYLGRVGFENPSAVDTGAERAAKLYAELGYGAITITPRTRSSYRIDRSEIVGHFIPEPSRSEIIGAYLNPKYRAYPLPEELGLIKGTAT